MVELIVHCQYKYNKNEFLRNVNTESWNMTGHSAHDRRRGPSLFGRHNLGGPVKDQI